MLKKSTLREIRSSLGRYLAILAIVMLGVGFFCGLKSTKPAMVATANEYLKKNKMYDYQLQSTLGLTEKDVDAVAGQNEVEAAEGSVTEDVLFHYEGQASDKVLRFHSITSKVNTIHLMKGRLPKAKDECVVDHNLGNDLIGKKIVISPRNSKSTRNLFYRKELKVVGTVTSPVYLNFERGTTSLGDGKVSGFVYMNRDAFDTDVFTRIDVKLKKNYPIYSKKYKNYIDANNAGMEDILEERAEIRYKDIVAKATRKWEKNKAKYEKNYNDFLKEKADTQQKLRDSHQKLTNNKAKLQKKSKELNSKEKSLKSNLKKVDSGIRQVNAAIEQSKAAGAPVDRLLAQKQQLQGQKRKIQDGLLLVKKGKGKIKAGNQELKKGFTKYNEAVATVNKEFREAEDQLADAKTKLDDGKKKIAEIDKADTYVLDRNTNTGYACFDSDSSIVDGICKVFPIFFFLVAALVCMTTMTRMVDAQRTEIGVLKALGYSNSSIIGKYLFYSCSASLLGAVTGLFAGAYIFPKVIWKAYGMMYDFNANLKYVLSPKLSAAAVGVSLLCAVSATLLPCLGDFREVPAQLIRPRAPKNGKRILLERIGFLWNRFSFLQKVTFRNIFRYKKRFLMMLIGISGCTALLVAGLGIRDSIQNVVNFQFDEIQKYDYDVTFDKNMTAEKQKTFRKNNDGAYKDILFVHKNSADILHGDQVKSIILIAAESKGFRQFVDLHNHAGKSISYPGKGQAVICKKLARNYNLSVGDEITLRDDDYHQGKVKISGICENYIYNYVYITPDTYRDLFGTAASIKSAMVRTATGSDKSVHQSATKLLKRDEVAAISINIDMRDRVNNMMKSLNAIVLVVVLSAGALAFIVLYNLTNINITERIREIATIKVLGFRKGETAAYVFRENIFLTGISALLGLGLGRILLGFIISRINIDLISFDTRITGFSYALAVILTFVFAFIVSIAMSRRLENISMTESLKSIE